MYLALHAVAVKPGIDDVVSVAKDDAMQNEE
jgi:hypothetical protein